MGYFDDLETEIADLATALATRDKLLLTLLSGNVTNLSALNTINKTSLVAAINELEAGGGGGGVAALDDLTDVTITSPTTGHVIRHDGTTWVNVLGDTYYQPRDTDLDTLASTPTTSYGRALLNIANQSALMGLLSAATEVVPGVVELATVAETTAGVDTSRAVTAAGVSAAINALVAGAPGLLNTLDEIAAALGDDPNFAATLTTSLAGKQPLDATLTALAAQVTAADRLIYATGVDSFAVTTLTPFARTILDDADAATVRTTIGAQPLDATLTALAGVTVAANQMIYATGPDAFAVTAITAFGRSLVGSADAAAARTTLDVYSKTEIGVPDTDFVAIYNAGLV